MTPTRIATLSAGAFVCLMAGCLNPYRTRLPSFFAGDPRVERRSIERYDPFPSRELGPAVFARPREFVDQRPDTRRLNEEGMLRGLRRGQPVPPPGGQPVPPPGVSTQNRYPNSVPE